MNSILRILRPARRPAPQRAAGWRVALLGLLLVGGPAAWAQRGKNGVGTITAAGTVVNTYTTLSADAASGTNSITVANSALKGGAFGATALAAGDYVMLIQMQGASITTTTGTSAYGAVTAYNNAGRYELLEVKSVPGSTSITFQCGLANSYTAAGQVQVVRIPRYTTLTLNANTSIVAPAWNGTTGGIVALDVQGDVLLNTNAKIDVSGLGFRGGAVMNASSFPNSSLAYASTFNVQGAEKGEGIAGSQATYDGLTGRYGRGAAANGGGGGNTHNAAGGGGSNVGTGTWTGTGNPASGYDAAWNLEGGGFASSTSPGGGRGGYSFSMNDANATTQGPGDTAWGGDNRLNQGGLGGRPLDVTNRLFLGGGGGAGDTNNSHGTAGGKGGGLIYVFGGGKIGGEASGALLANGNAAQNTSTGSDGPGGGGGGGTIVLNTVGSVETVTVSVAGGKGGDHRTGTSATAEAEGGGGGGGGGYLRYTSVNAGAVPVFSMVGGVNGVSNSSSVTEFPPNGATTGGAGVSTTATYNTQCLIIADVVTTLTTAQTAVLAGAAITYTPTVRNNSTTVTATDVAPTVQLPPALLNVVVSDKSGAILTNSAASGYNSLTGAVIFPSEASLPASTTLTYSIVFPAPNFTVTIAGQAQSTASANDPTPANNNGTAAAATVQTVVSLPDNGCPGTAYSAAGSGLYGEYYAGYFNDDLTYFASRTPDLTRTDGNLSFAADNGWGDILPPATGTNNNPDRYSARYRGNISIATAGAYTIAVASDDASYLWIDGAALATTPTLASAAIRNGGGHVSNVVSVTLNLSAGPHNMLLFYGDNIHDNSLSLLYSGPDTGSTQVTVPNSVLCPTLANVPPIAVAVTNSPAMANTAGATTINSLLGTDQDGTVTSYVMVTLPTAVQGVLSLGGTPVTAGQTITAAQAATLQFTPATTFTGNATFTFQAIDNSGQRSNNPATYTIPVVFSISGTVFEDVNYGGGRGRAIATANGVMAGSAVAVGTAGSPATAATVELYDGAGNFVATTQTSTTASTLGQYTFTVTAAGSYTVRVVNSTVRSTRPGSVAGLLPVQTYNGSTDRVGGEAPLRSDAPANTGSQTLAALDVATAGATIGTIAESQQAITLRSSSSAAGRDFGFNFDVVTNTNDAGQGSLRQFLTNANTLGNEAGLTQAGSRKDGANATVALAAGKETSIFMVPGTTAVAGLRTGQPSGLTGGVALITTTSTLNLTGANAANTVIDGGTQTYNLGTATGNTAAGTATGTSATTVGTDGLPVKALNIPEVEISGNNLVTVLDVEGTSATVRGLAIHGGNGAGDNTILVGSSASATGYLFENTLVGVTANGSRPGPNLTSNGFGIGIRANAGVGTVQNAFIAYTGNSGLHIDNGTGTAGTTQILGNQFLQNGYTNAGGDGVTFGEDGGSGPALVQGNLFTTPNSSGLQFEIGSTTATQVLNNTITGAGTGGLSVTPLEKAGIVYLQRNTTNRGSQLDVISKNVILSSAAAGIVVGYGQQNVTITQNQISGNAGLGIDLIATSTFIVGSGNGYGNGDGVTVNDGNNPATAANTLPNRGGDFPVLASATVTGTNLVLKGYARPGAKIELFSAGATADATGFGEGQTYLGTVTEGGAAGGGNLAADTDPRTALSYSGLINGLNQGTDANANGFSFTIPLSALPGGVLPSGTILSSTATLNNSTSEFSGVVKITADVTTTITGPGSIAAGQVTGTFTAAFSNAGNTPARSVGQAVTLPAGSTLTSPQLTTIQTAYPGTTFSGTTLSFPTAATLVAGASNVFNFVFTAPTASGTTTINTAVSTTTTQSPGTTLDAASFAIDVTPVADVTALIVGTGTTVSSGTTGTYTATFGNSGPSAAAGMVPTVQLSPNVSNVTINSAAPTSTTGGISTYAGGIAYDANTGVITAPAASLGNGATVVYTIGYTQPAQGNVTATAAITTTTSQGALSGNGNPATANDAQTATNIGGPGFDLATTLAGPASVVEGTQVTYAVTTSNSGPGAAPTAVQTVSMMTGAALTNVFLSNGGTYSFSGGTSLFTFPTIPSLGSGQQANYSISFTTPISASSSMALTALVTPGTTTAGDANTANNQLSISTTVTAAPAAAGTTANLNVAISSNAPTGGVAPGASVIFTVNQGNNGPNAATSVATRVYLPTGLTGVVAKDKSGITLTNTSTSGYNTATGVVIFPIEASEASAITPLTYTITANAPASGGVTATATVGGTNDPVPADNVALTAVTINQPTTGDVVTTLNGPATATPGESIVYTVSASNNSTTAAASVTQTVQLPAGLAGVAVRDAIGNVITSSPTTGYNAATGLVAFAPGTLAAGVAISRTITLPAPSNAGAATGGSIVPVASISTTSADNVLTNNSARITTVIRPSTDFLVRLTGPATTLAGNPVTYAVTVTNNGPSIGDQQTTVQLPTGLDLAGGGLITPTGATYNGTTGVLTLAAVTAQGLGSASAVTSAVSFNAPATLVLMTPTAQATPATGTNDANPANNAATVSTTVTPATETLIDLATTVTASVGTQTAGGVIIFTVTSTNNTAGSSATNAIEQLALAAGLTGVLVNGATPTSTTNGISTYPGGTIYDANTGVVTFPAVPLVNGTPLSRTVQVTAPGAGPLVARASLKGDQTDAATANNSASTSVTITPSADLVTSTTGPAATTPGTPVSYSVITTNNGPSAALNVVPTIALPAGATNVVLPAGASLSGSTVTFAATGNLTSTQSVTNTVTFTTSATAGPYAVNGSATTATPEPATANNGSTSTTTSTAPTAAPVAFDVVNKTTYNVTTGTVNSPSANTAGQFLLTPLSAAASAGQRLTSYTITSIPTAAQGTLYYNSSGTTYTTVPVNQVLTPAQAASLKFDPADNATTTASVGDITFGYFVTDNTGKPSNTALFTIPVGRDNNSVYTATPNKGGAAQYATNDVLAFVIDPNGAAYNGSGLVYNPAGTTATILAAGGNNGLVNQPGSVVQAISGNGPAASGPYPANPTNVLPAGVSLDATTGLIYVSNRALLVNYSTVKFYQITVTTTDVNGGTNVVTAQFSIGAYPLPVELTAFTATAVNNLDAVLAWRTASEKANDHFDVERSLNGTDFVKIGQVQGQGSKASPTDYALTDAGVARKAAGLVYYRLRQVDMDGTASYSPVRSVRFTKALTPSIVLFPNPATAGTQLDLTGLPTGTYEVSVLDATGRVVLSTQLEAGLAHALELNTIANGTYLVRVQGKTLVLTKRLIKE